MKRILLLLTIVAITAGTAIAAMGDLVASYPNQPTTSTSYHYGLAADSSYVYSYHYTTGRLIYRMVRSNGSLVSSYPNPLGTGSPNYYCRGMSYGGGNYLYMCHYYWHVVPKFYRSNGSLISTWAWGTDSRYGVCCEHDGTNPGSYLWLSNSSGTFWRYTTAGSLLSSFDIASISHYDLAWDYGNHLIWYANYSDEYVNAITTAGSLVASWRVPSAVTNPYGIAYYGQYLYVATTSGTPDEYIWVYDCPATVTINAASMGKVKALFH